MQCDRHVVKMILESAQLLSTAHRELDGDEWADTNMLSSVPTRTIRQPMWVRQSTDHYCWLDNHFVALCDEYEYRYGRRTLLTLSSRGNLRVQTIAQLMAGVDPPQVHAH